MSSLTFNYRSRQTGNTARRKQAKRQLKCRSALLRVAMVNPPLSRMPSGADLATVPGWVKQGHNGAAREVQRPATGPLHSGAEDSTASLSTVQTAQETGHLRQHLQGRGRMLPARALHKWPPDGHRRSLRNSMQKPSGP